MISSRFHTLNGSRQASKSHLIHDCLWRHVRHLVSRLTFGDEVHGKSKSRTLGCIEALLLLTEWHPRALAFPQFSNYDDTNEGVPCDMDKNSSEQDSASLSQQRWREELFEPAKRADRMSWMMLGIASSLAHELGVYDESIANLHETEDPVAKNHIKRLLYLNVNQLALTLGCASFLPPGISNSLLSAASASTDNELLEGEQLISLWIDLTSLLKMAKAMSFSGRSKLRAEAYDDLKHHINPLLKQWYHQFQSFKRVSKFVYISYSMTLRH